MANASENRSRIRIVWEYDRNHRFLPCAGIVGGITPAGDVRAEFYLDLGVTPDQQRTTVNQDEEENLTETTGFPSDSHAVRKILVSLLIPPSRLRSFSNWFREQADNYDELMREQKASTQGAEDGS